MWGRVRPQVAFAQTAAEEDRGAQKEGAGEARGQMAAAQRAAAAVCAAAAAAAATTSASWRFLAATWVAVRSDAANLFDADVGDPVGSGQATGGNGRHRCHYACRRRQTWCAGLAQRREARGTSRIKAHARGLSDERHEPERPRLSTHSFTWAECAADRRCCFYEDFFPAGVLFYNVRGRALCSRWHDPGEQRSRMNNGRLCDGYAHTAEGYVSGRLRARSIVGARLSCVCVCHQPTPHDARECIVGLWSAAASPIAPSSVVCRVSDVGARLRLVWAASAV
jgi:hypothetical protein